MEHIRSAIRILAVGLLVGWGVGSARAAEEVRIYTYMLPIQEGLTKVLSETPRTGEDLGAVRR